MWNVSLTAPEIISPSPVLFPLPTDLSIRQVRSERGDYVTFSDAFPCGQLSAFPFQRSVQLGCDLPCGISRSFSETVRLLAKSINKLSAQSVLIAQVM
jgi:hypothetical protein